MFYEKNLIYVGRDNNYMNNAQELLDFINKGKTAFQSTYEIKNILDKQGYTEIKEEDKWELKKGGKHYIIKNNSALIAFEIGNGDIEKDGFRLIGAHTDSPGFRIKPNPEMKVEGHYVKLNTEVYGGPILSTWFDRPLSIAGRVTLKGENPFSPRVELLDVNKPVLIIPNLAIHMNRSVNEGYEYNKQKDTLPMLTLVEDKLEEDNYLINLIAETLKVDSSDILDFDLFYMSMQKVC